MGTPSNRRSREPASLRFVCGIALTLLVSLAIFYLTFRPSFEELAPLAGFLSITAILSVAAGYGAYRLGWIHRSPRIAWTLLLGYSLSILLTFLNVWLTARLMFVNEHDLALAAILLLFAGGIALSLGYFLSSAVTESIVALSRAAKRIAEGDLGVRVEAEGRNEIAELAQAFNVMSRKLESSAREKEELVGLRRNLIAWVGHDLRTPLSSIRAIVEALADGVVEDPETVQRYLRTAQRDIQALSLLIDDLFEMAQLDTGDLPLERHDSSISDVISDTLESFSELAARREIDLQGSVTSRVDPVYMDIQRIGRVLSNLVSNALRHTPPGGMVEVNAWLEGDEVWLEVHDSGEGIPEGDLAHIFEQFYRSEKSRNRVTGGAGLGLAIARGIVEAHGGRIWAESVAGKGARFFFTLPRSKES